MDQQEFDVAEREDFRQEVRDFVEENLPPVLRVGNRPDLPAGPFKKWIGALADRGWNTPDWPVEYGGGGLDRKRTAILKAELEAARAPEAGGLGIRLIGPTLLEFGTDEQKKQHLPPISRHELHWCQGFSEPGAGSDLASLQCRAERDGDDYVITGQKIWTSAAQEADWIFCLVRTDFEAIKQAGISFILCELDQPSIEIAPLKLIDGTAHFCQVFFDGARSGVSQIVGPLHGGWAVAKRLLQYERAMDSSTTDADVIGDSIETIIDFVKREVGLEEGVLADPTLRERLAAHEIDKRALDLTMQRAMEEARAGHTGRDISTLGKYRWADMTKDEQEIAIDAAGTGGLGWEGPGFAESQLDRTRQFLITRANSIWGGTNEIQKNVIAKRVLGIPE